MFLSTITKVKFIATLAGLLILSGFSSCNSVIYDDLRPCMPEYRVRLSFDYNINNEERVSELNAAELYAFDEGGTLAESVAVDRATLEQNGWTVPVSNLKQNHAYDIILWGGLTEESPFILDGHTRDIVTKEDLICRLSTETDEEGNATSSRRFPALFHGYGTFTFTTEDGEEEKTLSVTKNTNTVNVIVRREDDAEVAAGDYPVRLIDTNAVYNHDNRPGESHVVHYYPVDITAGEFEQSNGAGTITGMSYGVKSEFHTARLLTENQPMLQILDKNRAPMVELNLHDMINEVRERIAPDMDMQEYLDREDTYTVEITVKVETPEEPDEDIIHICININNWEVVIQDFEWGNR